MCGFCLLTSIKYNSCGLDTFKIFPESEPLNTPISATLPFRGRLDRKDKQHSVRLKSSHSSPGRSPSVVRIDTHHMFRNLSFLLLLLLQVYKFLESHIETRGVIIQIEMIFNDRQPTLNGLWNAECQYEQRWHATEFPHHHFLFGLNDLRFSSSGIGFNIAKIGSLY